MIALLNSFFLVFIGEMGDKTQLLALMLYQRFKRPYLILLGIFIATLFNHLGSAYLGTLFQDVASVQYTKYILSAIFFIFGIWILFPDKAEENKKINSSNILLTTTALFFIAELGDKTQLTTIALSAKYNDLFIVTAGTTLGMLASNGLVIIFGDQLLKNIPMQWIRRLACLLFFIFGVTILFS